MLPSKPTNSFRLLWKEITSRMCAPMLQVSFWMNLIIGVILMGGIGIWFELVRSTSTPETIATAICVYFPALGAAAAMQIVTVENGKSYLRSTAYGAGIVLILLAVVLLARMEEMDSIWSVALGTMGAMAAIAIWWIANGGAATFQDADPDAATGGDASIELGGDVTGYKV